MSHFHWIRPYWLLALVPTFFILWGTLSKASVGHAWRKACDAHLLPFLMETHGRRQTWSSFLWILSSMLMIISLSGPSWTRFPVPTYQKHQPRVVVLSLSEDMLETDLSPNRLQRAKFKLHDLFLHQEADLWGLVVYTGEPFVVSPLTDDAQTIEALLPTLAPDIMPVQGLDLSMALQEARLLITQAGFHQGQILVMSASPPTGADVKEAKILSKEGFLTSIMPVLGHETAPSPYFQMLASAGGGQLIPMSDTSSDLDQWLSDNSLHREAVRNAHNDIPVWRDEGRWFLIPALVLLLPLFRRETSFGAGP